MNANRLVQGAAWNLAGLVLPLAAALVAVPGLVRALGPERFGVLTLAWALVGYFTLFDLGIGAVDPLPPARRGARRGRQRRRR